MHEYKTRGTCSTKIRFEIDRDTIRGISFDDGCNGNLKALSILAEGMNANDLVRKLKGLHCGKRTTSCGDQLACAVEAALSKSSIR